MLPTGRATAQTFTNLHSFTSENYNGATGSFTNSDGAQPTAGLILSGNTLYGTAVAGGDSGNGTVFAVNTNGTGFTNLYNFTPLSGPYPGTNSDGDAPHAGLILSGGNLYGTTYAGGSSGNGTVFADNTNGTCFTNLYSFTGGNDGSHPEAGLILSGNKLFGTAESGGNSGNGTVFAINTNGTGFTNLYSFTGSNDGSHPEAGLILSGNTLFGTAESGGNSGNGTVFAINTNGTGFTTLISFTNGSREPVAGLILSGNALYGTAQYGGSSGGGTVFKVNTNGTGFTNLYSFTGGSDGAYPLAGLILSGNTLYGTAYSFGSSGEGTVFAVSTNGTGFTTLYSFTTLSNNNTNSDGAQSEAGLILSGNTLYGTACYGGSAGEGTAFSLTLPAALPPSITNQPASATVSSGGTAVFTTGVSGTPPFSYQWLFNGGVLTGDTNATLTLTTVMTNNAGNYSVVVTNVAGSATSSNTTLTVIVPPTITSEPATVAVSSDGTATFTVGVSGTSPFSYQWRFNESVLTGDTNATLMLTAVTTNDAGNYSVVVANLAGSVISSNAMLSIVPQFNVSPVLKNTTSLGAFFNITWSSIPGEIYLVEYKNSLTQNNWYILGGPNVATNTTATAYDIISPDSPTRFYRLWLLATNAANTQPPATIVSSPTASEQWTNAMLTVNGTSSDVSAVAAVFYKLNTGPWTAATTTNAWANWSASVTLIPGTNTFLSYAVDTSGNFSTTNTVAFVWEADYAFDYVGTYGNPVTITYTNQSQQIVQASGFPGQVQLFVTTNTPPLTVQTFAQLNGGFVIAQIPLVGYYLISVTNGDEAHFIAVANPTPGVISASPNVPLASASDILDLRGLLGANGELPVVPNINAMDAQVGANAYLYVNDDFTDLELACQSGISHGAGVDYVASTGLSGTGQQMNLSGVASGSLTEADLISADDVMFEENLMRNQGGRVIVNVSQQGDWGTPDNPLDKAIYAANETKFLNNTATMLNNLPDNQLSQMVFVVASGNGASNNLSNGVDLCNAIGQLHIQFPRVFTLGGGPHMIIVGGTNGGSKDTGANYSSCDLSSDGTPLMVYTQDRNVVVNGSGCIANGTSFAAPAVSSLIAQLLSANPNLTVDQVTAAFMQSAAANNYSVPTSAQVQAILNSLLTYTLTLGTAGTGSGTVSASPPGPTYAAGQVVNLTAMAASGSAFAGWSGNVTSTGATTGNITMNGNESITATFSMPSGPFSVSPTYVDLGDICDDGGGTWSVVFNVTAPAETAWFVYEDASGNFDVTYSTSAGTGSGTLTVTYTAGCLCPPPQNVTLCTLDLGPHDDTVGIGYGSGPTVIWMTIHYEDYE